MSFLKITDPEKRDLIVKEFLETKKNIQESQLRERAGKREFKDLGKFFKPVTDVQKSAAEEIKEELIPLKEIVPAIEGIPGPQLIIQQALPGLEKDTQSIGDIAYEYLSKIYNKDELVDKTFGLYNEGNKFYMGDKSIKIKGNDIVVGYNRYEGTRGLWELIMKKKPDDEIYDGNDLKIYSLLLTDTNTMHKFNEPENNQPKSSKGYKWNQIVSPIWHERYKYKYKLKKHEEKFKREREEESEEGATGSGLSDPNTLIERLDLLMESKKAGNTGVRTELVSICDELKKQKILNTKQHKIILKKC